MIVLDIETSGVYTEKHGICEIAAMDFDNLENTFHGECRIDDDEGMLEQALKIIGKTEEELRDKKRQSQKELLKGFFEWCKTVKVKNICSQNPFFDLQFISMKARKHLLETPLPYKSFDLHTIANVKYFEVYGEFLVKDNNSDMGFTNVLNFCGLNDNRMSINQKTNEIIKEGVPHDALNDTKLHAEAFSRLVYGKNLLKQFVEMPVPDYLKK